MSTAWFSLRRRLLVLLLAGASACWLVTVVWSYIDVHHEIDEMFEVEHVQAPENDHERHELVQRIAKRLLLPALFGLPLLAAWIWLATHRALAPLRSLAGEIAAREPERLSPLVPATAPVEVRPLLDALNALFGRVGQALEAERRFTADAAHELRTPLAALAAQAQVAERARDDAERQHAIAQLVVGSRRAARLVEQLLTLARLDPEAEAPAARVDLQRLAEEVCAAHGSLAIEKGIALSLDARPAGVSGNADTLGVLLRNLVDNALRYTPAGGRVQVEVRGGERPELAVVDSGPGIPAEARQRVFARFHRLAGQDSEGSGLGLSIVARIAERHGASVRLEDAAGGGLRAVVGFPSAG
jgi:signal transduction histidine kinase